MAQVTKDDLRAALRAWEIAREKALLENQRNADFLKNQQILIQLLIDGGATAFSAKRDVDQAAAAQLEAFHAAWQEMNDRCREYDELLEASRHQQAATIA